MGWVLILLLLRIMLITKTSMTGTDVYLTLPRLGTNLEGIEV
jgi:hypothetical protein